MSVSSYARFETHKILTIKEEIHARLATTVDASNDTFVYVKDTTDHNPDDKSRGAPYIDLILQARM